MILAGCQINPIDVNFHLQKSLEIFDTNSADKIQFQNYKEVKVPCLMPIRVKTGIILKKRGGIALNQEFYGASFASSNYKFLIGKKMSKNKNKVLAVLKQL